MQEGYLIISGVPGICKLLEDSLRMILSFEWPLRPLEVEWALLMFSADLAALITILSKDAEETVLLAACGVTSIFKIFLLSSSEAAVLVFLGDSEKKMIWKLFWREFHSFWQDDGMKKVILHFKWPHLSIWLWAKTVNEC